MTYKIPKSWAEAFDDYPAEVINHAKEWKAWHAHMKRVEDDRADETKATHDRHTPYPCPVAHPHIDNAVRHVVEGGVDDFIPDFEIIDDGATTEQIHRLKTELSSWQSSVAFRIHAEALRRRRQAN